MYIDYIDVNITSSQKCVRRKALKLGLNRAYTNNKAHGSKLNVAYFYRHVNQGNDTASNIPVQVDIDLNHNRVPFVLLTPNPIPFPLQVLTAAVKVIGWNEGRMIHEHTTSFSCNL